ncbi:hypothetical protein GCM10010360_75720 [Streptomyces nogalater]
MRQIPAREWICWDLGTATMAGEASGVDSGAARRSAKAATIFAGALPGSASVGEVAAERRGEIHGAVVGCVGIGQGAGVTA